MLQARLRQLLIPVTLSGLSIRPQRIADYEVATDLGSAASIEAGTTSISLSNIVDPFGTTFKGVIPTTVEVAYFAITGRKASSGPAVPRAGTETNNGIYSQKRHFYNALALYRIYNTAAPTGTAAVNYNAWAPAITPSYYGYMDKNNAALMQVLSPLVTDLRR